MVAENFTHENSFTHERLLVEFCHDPGDSARRNLSAGGHIYYRHDAFQEEGYLIKEYSSGRLELIKADDEGHTQLIRVIKE